MEGTWSLLVPVKRLERAKTRLAADPGVRRSLALAFARDTVLAAAACPAVGAVFAVTADPEAQRALSELGAVPLDGEPDGGLNPALRHGAAAAALRRPGHGVAALSADLPALRPQEPAVALAEAGQDAQAFAADAAGIGTTLYAAASAGDFAPAFEGGSRLRHRSRGAAEIGGSGLAGLRRDVDTAADLAAAAELGLGPHTAAAAAGPCRRTA
ncbi:2-phospho-L-lactate guanylyltransferase [Nocardiopsis coralliicola]